MLKIVFVGGLTAALMAAPIVEDPVPGPPPGSIVVDVVTVNGSSCGAGFFAVSVSPDYTIDLQYSQFLAWVGVGSGPGGQRSSCQFALAIHVPSGFTYGLPSMQHSGFASLAAGANATLRTVSYFQGQPAPPSRTFTFTGPYNDDVLAAEPADPASLAGAAFAPCDRLVNINFVYQLQVNPGTSDVKRTTSFIELGHSTSLPLVWKRC